MIYTPNIRHWKVGDFVIHDADAKQQNMLMVVLRYTVNGECVTKYADPERGNRTMTNPVEYLHDPAIWHIRLPLTRLNDPKRPEIICLCGSTRFSKEYQEFNLKFTLAGKIVLTIGADMKSDSALFSTLGKDELDTIKRDLDNLHLRKIDLADTVFIINVEGYVGESTAREVDYARGKQKQIVWMNGHVGMRTGEIADDTQTW